MPIPQTNLPLQSWSIKEIPQESQTLLPQNQMMQQIKIQEDQTPNQEVKVQMTNNQVENLLRQEQITQMKQRRQITLKEMHKRMWQERMKKYPNKTQKEILQIQKQIAHKRHLNLTHIPQNAQPMINKATSWKELYQIQKQLTPQLQDSLINEVMRLYHEQAKVFHKRGTLNPDQAFLLQNP